MDHPTHMGAIAPERPRYRARLTDAELHAIDVALADRLKAAAADEEHLVVALESARVSLFGAQEVPDGC